MERLKAMIPMKMRRLIDESTSDDLPATASTLHDFFAQSSAFRSMIDDLTSPQRRLCAKNKESALQLKDKGNASFSRGDYSKATQFYTKALRVAPMDAIDKDIELVATLYVNRASCLHILHSNSQTVHAGCIVAMLPWFMCISIEEWATDRLTRMESVSFGSRLRFDRKQEKGKKVPHTKKEKDPT